MKILLSSRRLFIIGFLILLAANIFVLAGVVANRTGGPHAHVELTERELQIPYYIPKENSGVSFNIQWRVLGKENERYDYGYYSHWRNPEWFTAGKLTELGFDINAYKNFRENFDSYREPIAKEVFIVLENNSDLHTKAVKRVEKAVERIKALLEAKPEDKNLQDKAKRVKEQLEREKVQSSRLFAIDAGLDAKRLQSKYPDRSKYILAKGLVEPSRTYQKGDEEVVGYISKLSIERIHVPLKHRKILDAISQQKKLNPNETNPPRYSVQLAYGRRLEPWIVSVNKLNRIQINPKRVK